MSDEFDQLVDDLTEADRQNPSLPQMNEPDDERIAADTTELSLKKKAQQFYNPDQLRDQGGKFVDEGKHAGEPGYKNPDEAGLTGIDKRIVDYVARRPLTRQHEDVRSIRKYVDGIHYVPYSKTPFFDQLNKLQGTPDVETVDIKKFAEARKALFEKQPISVLKIDDLIATQPVVNKDKVKRNIRQDHIKAISVVHHNDRHFVMDGHHALAAAAKRGDHSIEAHVLPLSDKQQFDQQSGKTQERDASGKYTNEGKVGGTTIEPRLPGLTRHTAQPVLPGYRTNPPHHAEIFYSPNETNMGWSSALEAMNGSRQKVALDVNADVDFQLGLKSHALNAVGDWSDGAENSVVNEISNIRDFDEVRYAAALKGKQLHQKAVLAFEEDQQGKDAIYNIEIPHADGLDNTPGTIKARMDNAGLTYKTIIPGSSSTTVVVFNKDDTNPLNTNTKEALQRVGWAYLKPNDIKITKTKGTGEFVGEAEGRTEAGTNYDKIIRDYEAKYPNRRHYVRAQGTSDHDNWGKVARAGGSTHLLSKVTSKEYGNGGSSTVYHAKFEDGSQGIWKPESGASTAGRAYITEPISPREAASYEVAKEVGLDDLVPETVIRDVDGETGSMQDFVKDSEIGANADSQYEYDGDKDLARAAAFDYLIGNTDRHFKNWMINNKDHSLHLIDNGLTFPTKAGGFANEWLLDRARQRGLGIPTEASKWTDHLPAIKKIMEARGLEDSYDALEHRANELAKASEFKKLGNPSLPHDVGKLGDLIMKSSSPAKRVELKPAATGAAPDLASRKGEARQIAKDRPLRLPDAKTWDAAKLKEIKALPSKNDADSNIIHASEYVNRHGIIVKRDGPEAEAVDQDKYDRWLSAEHKKVVRWNKTEGWHYQPRVDEP